MILCIYMQLSSHQVVMEQHNHSFGFWSCPHGFCMFIIFPDLFSTNSWGKYLSHLLHAPPSCSSANWVCLLSDAGQVVYCRCLGIRLPAVVENIVTVNQNRWRDVGQPNYELRPTIKLHKNKSSLTFVSHYQLRPQTVFKIPIHF